MPVRRDTLSGMTLYEVYVTCDQCGQPHSVHVQLSLESPDLNKTPLREVYPGGDLPSAIAYMQTNKYRCPHTKQLFPASDIDQAMLIAA